MSNVVNLTVKTTSDLSKLQTDLRGISTEAKTTATSLKSTTTQLDQSARSAQSFGQKVKGFGSQFGQVSTNVATLGGSVLNLSRQYQDLSDTQIRVDRTTLKLSKSNEAVQVAQQKLNEATAKYGAGSAEAQKATLDLTQAQEQQKLATTLLGEALEDQQRANEDFWLGLAPTITSGVGTAMSAVKAFTGDKGLGGIKAALTGLGGKAGGLVSGVANAIGLIGTNSAAAAPGVTGLAGATTGLGTAMKSVALSAIPVTLAIAGILAIIKPMSVAISGFNAIIKKDTLAMLDSLQAELKLFTGETGNMFTDFFRALDPSSAFVKLFAGGTFDQMNKKLEETKQHLISTGEGASTATSALDPFAGAMKTADDIVTQLNPAIDKMQQGVTALPPPLNDGAAALDNIGTAADTATEKVGNFATMTKTGLGEIKGGSDTARMSINGVTVSAQELVNVMTTGHTIPFGQNLQQVGELADFASSEVDILTRSAVAGATAFQSGASAAGAAAQALQGYSNSVAGANTNTINFQTGVTNAGAALKTFMNQTQQNVAGDKVWRDGLTAAIGQLTGVELSAAFTTEQLKQLYAAAAESKAQFNTLLASLRKTEQQLWRTGAAAEVTYGKLVPGRHGIPKGGRSGTMRMRSDYQRALIGSPQAQRQMLAGSRPKVYAGPKKAQHGMHEFLRKDTMIWAHKGENVNIDKPGRGGTGVGSHITISFLPAEFAQFLRYSINDNQGVMK